MSLCILLLALYIPSIARPILYYTRSVAKSPGNINTKMGMGCVVVVAQTNRLCAEKNLLLTYELDVNKSM